MEVRNVLLIVIVYVLLWITTISFFEYYEESPIPLADEVVFMLENSDLVAHKE